MRRRVFLVLAWLVATVGATTVAWQAVAFVGRQVTDERTVAASTEPSVVPSAGEPEDATTTTMSGTPAPAETASTPGHTTTYNLRGGSVGVRCEGTSIALLWATPASGFTVIVNHGGPDEVDVRFEAENHRSRLDADCRAGELAAEPREDD